MWKIPLTDHFWIKKNRFKLRIPSSESKSHWITLGFGCIIFNNKIESRVWCRAGLRVDAIRRHRRNELSFHSVGGFSASSFFPRCSHSSMVFFGRDSFNDYLLVLVRAVSSTPYNCCANVSIHGRLYCSRCSCTHIEHLSLLRFAALSSARSVGLAVHTWIMIKIYFEDQAYTYLSPLWGFSGRWIASA